VHDPQTGRVLKQGPPIFATKVFHGGIREARRALAAFAVEASEERTVGKSATVNKLMGEYLASLARLDRASSTIETYRMHFKNHIRPGLGSIRLERLSTHDVDKFLAELAEKGLAPRTIALVFSVLSGALSQAVDWGWLASNPAKKARLSEPQVAETTHLSTDDLRALYEGALADEDIDMAVTIALAAWTGCRRGELCGLRWEDLDVEGCRLRIERQWRVAKGGQELAPPKNKKPRTVHIGEGGVALLLRYRAAKAAQLGWVPDGWLLSYNGGATPMRAKSITEYVGRLAKRLGVDAHLHTMRHWAGTELHHQGVDLPTAAGQLGNTTEVLAKVYLHTDDGRGAVAGDKMAAVLGPVFSSG
jgi:integrase